MQDSGNTLVDPAQLEEEPDVVRADLHIDTAMDQSCMEFHTRPVADKVHTAAAWIPARSARRFLSEVEVAQA